MNSDEIQFIEMQEYSEIEDDMPDGAFFALAEQMYGWTVDDWAWYSENYNKYSKKKR